MTHTELGNKILQGGRLAIERLLARKRRDNAQVVVSENGKVLKIDAKDLKQ